MHVAAGQCITVHFTNRRTVRASFHSGLLSASANGNTDYGSASSGVDVGFGPEQTVAPGGSRDYRLYADTAKLGATLISDFGGATVAVDERWDAGQRMSTPARSACTARSSSRRQAPPSPSRRFGGTVSIGAQVDVHVPGAGSYRDFTVLLQDTDQDIGQSHMPYPTEVKGVSAINYGSGPAATSTSDGNGAFAATNSGPAGTPATPMLKAYVGDPVEVHALVTPGSEQMHVFGLGGESWPLDPFLAGLQRGAGPRDRPLGDAAGEHPRRCRRRDHRRRHLLRRSATPVHRRRHVGHPARHVGRELPDQAARRPRLRRRCRHVRHARRRPRPQSSSPTRFRPPPSRRPRSSPPSNGPAIRRAPIHPGEGRTRDPGPCRRAEVQGLAQVRRARSALQAGACGHGTAGDRASR